MCYNGLIQKGGNKNEICFIKKRKRINDRRLVKNVYYNLQRVQRLVADTISVVALTPNSFGKPTTYNPTEEKKENETYILRTCTKNGYKIAFINEEKALRLFRRRGKKIIESYCKFMASAPYPIINPLFCLVGRIKEFLAMPERRFGHIAGFEISGETKSAKSWDTCLCKKYGVSKRDFAIGRITFNASKKRVMELEPVPYEVVMQLDPIDVEFTI